MMKRKFAAPILLIALAACGTTVSHTNSERAASPVSVADTSTTSDGDESDLEASQPFLTVFAVCYSTCPPTYAMPQFAMYGEDALVVIDRAEPENPTSEYRGRTFVLSPEDVALMWDLISDGGLTRGGIHAAGTREGVADGGGLVFESQIGDEVTYLHAPFLDEPGGEARTALFDLLTLFRSYTEADGSALSLEWVMVGQSYPEPEVTTWERDERPQGSPPCLAFDPEDLGDLGAELTSQESHENKWISFDGTTHAMQGRPLLPGENGCDDVQERLRRVAANDATLNLGGAG